MFRLSSSVARLCIVAAVCLGPGDRLLYHSNRWESCPALDVPKRLPGLDQLFDSTALFNSLESQRTTGRQGVVLLRFMPSDSQPFVRLDPQPSPSAVDSLIGTLKQAVRGKPEFGAPSLRLRFKFADRVTGSVERSQLCPPVQIGGPTEIRIPFESPAGASPPRLNEAIIRMRIGLDGSVRDATVTRSSGDPQVDRIFLEAQQQSHYKPASLDGRPVEVWFDGKRAWLAAP